MVLEVLADAAQVDSDRNIDSPQVFGRTDPREHQQFWRSERSCCEQHLATAPQRVPLTSANVLYAHRSLMFEQNPADLRSRFHAQSGIWPDFAQKSVRRAATTPAVSGKLQISGASGRPPLKSAVNGKPSD